MLHLFPIAASFKTKISQKKQRIALNDGIIGNNAKNFNLLAGLKGCLYMISINCFYLFFLILLAGFLACEFILDAKALSKILQNSYNCKLKP